MSATLAATNVAYAIMVRTAEPSAERGAMTPVIAPAPAVSRGQSRTLSDEICPEHADAVSSAEEVDRH